MFADMHHCLNVGPIRNDELNFVETFFLSDNFYTDLGLSYS